MQLAEPIVNTDRLYIITLSNTLIARLNKAHRLQLNTLDIDNLICLFKHKHAMRHMVLLNEASPLHFSDKFARSIERLVAARLITKQTINERHVYYQITIDGINAVNELQAPL